MRLRGKRLLIGALAAAVVLLALAIALTPPLSERVVHRWVLPKVSQRLGVDLAAGSARLHLFPEPRVVMKDLTVALPGRGPMVSVHRAEADVDVWAAVRSAGHDLHATAVRVDSADVSLDLPGALWADRMLNAFAKPAPKGQRELRVDKVVLDEATVRARDVSTPLVNALHAEITGLSHGKGAVSFRGAALGDQPNVTGQLQLSPLRGSFQLTDADLSVFAPLLPGGMGDGVEAGRVSWTGELVAQPGGYAVEGDAALQQLEAFGLGPAAGQARVKAKITIAEGEPSLSAKVEAFNLKGPNATLRGVAAVRTHPAEAFVRVEASSINAGALLTSLAAKPKTDRLIALAEKQQKALRAIAVSVDAKVKQFRFERLTVSAVRVRAQLNQGRLTALTGQATLLGGSVDFSGSSIDLTGAAPALAVKASGKALDAGEMTKLMTGRQMVSGKGSGQVRLTGTGADYPAIRETLHGEGKFTVNNWRLARRGLLKKIGNLAPNRSFTGRFVISDGAARLRRPVPLVIPLPESLHRRPR